MSRRPRHPLARPDLGAAERRHVLAALRENAISSLGRHVADFEAAFSERMAGRSCVAVSSGTAAVHLALAALDLGPGDEVIVPDLTFVASASAVRYTGARVVLVDVDRATWNLDPERVAAAVTRRTRAILAVHLYGNPAPLAALRRIAREHGLALVEDAAQALGARWRGRPIGTAGDLACFSFYGNKFITTGEGGMVVARTRRLARRLAHLRDHGMSPTRRYYHDELAFNYRMTALQAGVGLGQLASFERFLARRARIERWYRAELGAIPRLVYAEALPGAEPVTWLHSFVMAGASRRSRDRALASLGRRGVDTRPFFLPMSRLPMYRARGYPEAARLSDTGISLPTHTRMTRADVRAIGAHVRAVLGA